MPAHFSGVARVYGEVRTTDPDPVHYVRDALAGRASVRAADIGCGDGRYDRLLFDHIPGLRLICVDSSAQMLERVSENLSGAGIRTFTVRLSDVNELSLARESLDAIITFNAIHHFDVPAFLKVARRGLAVGGRLFIYTRTPEQNARCIWGRFFPGFTEKESRLHPAERMEAWITEASGIALLETKPFRYRRTASLKRLLQQARSRHYSTFSLYDERNFEAACRKFEARIRRAFDDLGAIRWHDENIMLHLGLQA